MSKQVAPRDRCWCMEIRELQNTDHKRAIQFAIRGMHFDWYTDSRIVLQLYGRYFWYLKLCRATQILAVYDEQKLCGVLLAEMSGEKPAFRSWRKLLYIACFNWLQRMIAGAGARTYDAANTEMFHQYRKEYHPDGELIFLAADPDRKGMGIGTMLLNELERRESGKTIYLFTDSGCAYTFYDHRGFIRTHQRDIMLELQSKRVPLSCYLYSKTCVDRTDDPTP